MSKVKKVLIGMAVGAAALAPAAPAFADDNPCKGQAPGPHCRPACFYYVYVDEGDPANGIAPTVELRRTFC
jgi:hypothetical protein